MSAVWKKAWVFGAAMLASASCLGKSTGVGDDPALQTGPCYQALVDKNAANPTTAPNRELGSACEAENGDVEKAWARVLRLWGSDSVDVPDYDSYRRADASVEGAPPRWLAISGLLLVYFVLGTPMRSAARLLGAHGRRTLGATMDAGVALGLRFLIAAAWIALFGLPYLAALGGVALIALILTRLRRVGPTASPATDEKATGASVHLAEAINDAGGAAAGLAALALFVQHDSVLLAAGLALALIASTGPVIAARRALRAAPFARPAAAALLAAAIGEVLIGAPPLSGWVGGFSGATIVAPVLLGALTLAVGWRLALPVAARAEA